MTTLIKLGGSLITDKNKAKSFRRDVLRDIARQLRQIRSLQPSRPIVLGHGSGSFGHVEAQKYNTVCGFHDSEERLGFARVGAVATELSQLVLFELLAAGLPVMRFQPASMVLAVDKKLQTIDTRALLLALENQLIPLIHGDIALDKNIGGTIISTEALFAHLVAPLGASEIILLGEVDGVLDQQGNVIPKITPAAMRELLPVLGGSSGVDVTGGMQQKVREMVALVEQHPKLNVVIANGNRSQALVKLLTGEPEVGTRISVA